MGQTTKILLIDQNNNGKIEAGEIIGLSTDREEEKGLRKKLADNYIKKQKVISPNELIFYRSPDL